MKVREGTLERALQVMAQVVAVLERQGHSVGVSDTGGTIALINNERVFFGIEEPFRKVVVQKPRVPNPTDRWDYDETRLVGAGRQAGTLHPFGHTLGTK